jgi:hypothetical protein
MHRYISLLGWAFLLFTCTNTPRQRAPLQTGTEQILAGKIYVVHSLSLYNNTPNMTSNIFVIKGTGDTAWIYNCGYGNGGVNCDETCNDYTYYKGKGFTTAKNATEDVKQVDSILQNVFLLDKDSVILQFIVPHFHADHINQEFIDAFYTTFRYPYKSSCKILVHVNDSVGSVCGEPCCGTIPCGTNKKNKYYASPYNPPWSINYLSMFDAMGNDTDTCNTALKTFTSASGNWVITKGMSLSGGGHTDGTINLHNEALKIRIAGTNNKPQCPLPVGWKTASVHGNIPWLK